MRIQLTNIVVTSTVGIAIGVGLRTTVAGLTRGAREGGARLTAGLLLDGRGDDLLRQVEVVAQVVDTLVRQVPIVVAPRELLLAVLARCQALKFPSLFSLYTSSPSDIAILFFNYSNKCDWSISSYSPSLGLGNTFVTHISAIARQKRSHNSFDKKFISNLLNYVKVTTLQALMTWRLVTPSMSGWVFWL